MISRVRLHEANKHAKRRLETLRSLYFPHYQHLLPPWQKRRKVTKPCSCYMCGNERRHFQVPPMQERKQRAVSIDAGILEWIEEAYSSDDTRSI